MVTDMDTAVNVAEVLNGLVVKAETIAQMQRDPNVAPGTVLSEGELEGAIHREVKAASMVRMGRIALPERFAVWDIYGNQRMVPTAQMARMLSKPNAERKDLRAFHTHSSGVTQETCTSCPPVRPQYEGTCQWCMERTRTYKKFADEAAYEAHCDTYHPREWMTLQRTIERTQRLQEFETQKELAQAMMAMARAQSGVVEPAVVLEQVKAAKAMVDCPDCGKTVKEAGLAFHQRRWCPSKAV